MSGTSLCGKHSSGPGGGPAESPGEPSSQARRECTKHTTKTGMEDGKAVQSAIVKAVIMSLGGAKPMTEEQIREAARREAEKVYRREMHRLREARAEELKVKAGLRATVTTEEGPNSETTITTYGSANDQASGASDLPPHADDARESPLNDQDVEGHGTQAKPDHRLATWDAQSKPLTIGCILKGYDRSVNAVTPTVEEGWQKMAVTVDSEAEVSDMPTSVVPNYEVVAPDKPSWFSSATGEKMADRGEQLVPMQLNSGAIKTMPFRNTNVTKPLAAVMSMCKVGHAVLFLDQAYGGSCVIDLETGEVEPMREDGGNYVLDVWVPPPSVSGRAASQPIQGESKLDTGTGFVRQP